MNIPQPHQTFLDRALPLLQQDSRILGVAAAGSWIRGALDAYSDLDLVIAVAPEHHAALMGERHELAARLGELLAAFTGEHVGEPRLLICLYDHPLLHVDLKFVAVDDLAERVEDPTILWERDGALSAAMAARAAAWPHPDPQWIEDRFWVWVHYGALKLGRGEYFEIVETLSFLRMNVLGPYLAIRHGQLPRGVRFAEQFPAEDVAALRATVAAPERASCAAALQAAVALYVQLREAVAPEGLVRREAAQAASVQYLKQTIGE